MPTAERHPTKGSQLGRSMMVTLLSQAVVAVGGLVVFRQVAAEEGIGGFADYSLVRQSVTLLVPIITVGLVGGLPRAIATRTAGSPRGEAFLLAAASMMFAALVACLLVGTAVPGTVAELLFGRSNAERLLPAVGALLAATLAFHLAFGWYRGIERIGPANLLQVVGASLLPVVLAFTVLAEHDVVRLVLLMAAGLGVGSLVLATPALVRGARGARQDVRSAGAQLAAYGPRRVPGELAQMALIALTLVIAAHLTGTRDVAHVAAGLQLVQLAMFALNPIGIVLLPALARSWADDRAATRTRIARISAAATYVGLFVGGQALVLGDLAVSVVFGEDFENAGGVVRAMVVALPLVVYSGAMRSSLDAVAVRSYNSRCNLLALAAAGACLAVLRTGDLLEPVWCVAAAFSVGLATQGVLTAFFVRRVVGVAVLPPALATALLGAAGTAAASLALRSVMNDGAAALAVLVVASGALALAYLAALRLRGILR